MISIPTYDITEHKTMTYQRSQYPPTHIFQILLQAKKKKKPNHPPNQKKFSIPIQSAPVLYITTITSNIYAPRPLTMCNKGIV